MGTATALILIAGMAGATYATRLPLWVLAVRRVRPPRLVALVLDQIPIAAFAAIVFPGVLQPDGATEIDPSNLYLYAAAITVAAGIALRACLLATILFGVVTAVALQVVF